MLSGLGRRRDHRIAVRQVRSHGLFAEYVDTGFQTLDGNGLVQMGRQRNGDRIEVFAGKHFGRIGVDGGAIEIQRVRAGIDIALFRRSGDRGGIAHRHHLRVAERLPVPQVDAAHETHPDYAHSNHDKPSTSQPLRYSLRINLFAARLFLNRSLAASHCRVLFGKREASAPSRTASVSGPP